MKLYFYFFDEKVVGGIKKEECEVIEKPKTYAPKNKFPDGFYGRYVFKSEIGKILGYAFSRSVVILESNDEDQARKIYEHEIIKKLNIFNEEEAVYEKFYEILNQK